MVTRDYRTANLCRAENHNCNSALEAMMPSVTASSQTRTCAECLSCENSSLQPIAARPHASIAINSALLSGCRPMQ